MLTNKIEVCQDLLAHPHLGLENNVLMYPTLTTNTKSGKTQSSQLQIRCFDSNQQILKIDANSLLNCKQTAYAEIIIKQITSTGKVQKKQPEIINSGKNLGKKNATTILQQAILQADKKFETMQKKKHDDSRFHPMLLTNYAYAKCSTDNSQIDFVDAKLVQFPIYAQTKIDGLRCIYYNTTTYSRGFQEYVNLKHINSQVKQLLEDVNYQYTIILDGELFSKDLVLQDINKIVRCSTTDSTCISYNIFDVDVQCNQGIQQQLTFTERLQILTILKQSILKLKLKSIEVIETHILEDDQQLKTFFTCQINDKYEGMVLRIPQGLYRYSVNSYRSQEVMRCKPRLDLDLCVDGYLQGKGQDLGAILWQCTQEGQKFKVVQNELLVVRKLQYTFLQENPKAFELLKQVPLMIEFGAYSTSGTPTQPRGIRFRFDKVFITPQQLEMLKLFNNSTE